MRIVLGLVVALAMTSCLHVDVKVGDEYAREMSAKRLASAKEAVRQAEINFADAFKRRDTAAFRSFLDENTRFLAKDKTLRGPDEVIAEWKGMIESKSPPFSWTPERTEINGDGTLALSNGPVLDPKGNRTGSYYSIWQRKPDGTWKVIFDGPGGP